MSAFLWVVNSGAAGGPGSAAPRDMCYGTHHSFRYTRLRGMAGDTAQIGGALRPRIVPLPKSRSGPILKLITPGGYGIHSGRVSHCLLYTSDAADDLHCVDLGGCRIIKKKKITYSLVYIR